MKSYRGAILRNISRIRRGLFCSGGGIAADSITRSSTTQVGSSRTSTDGRKTGKRAKARRRRLFLVRLLRCLQRDRINARVGGAGGPVLSRLVDSTGFVGKEIHVAIISRARRERVAFHASIGFRAARSVLQRVAARLSFL